MKRTILLLNLALAVTTAQGQTAVQAWVQRYNGPGNGSDSAKAMMVDGNGDVIVTGYATETSSAYPFYYTDYATIKYSSAGVPLWTNRYDGPGSYFDIANAVVVDGSNDVIVTGYSSDSGATQDYATIKYSSAGVPLWTNLYNGTGNGEVSATAVAVDSSNNVIVTGYSSDSGAIQDYTTIKYSSAGVPLWTNRYDQLDRIDSAIAVAVDGCNSVIVTVYSAGGRNPGCAIVKYSSDGVPLWTNCYNGTGINNGTGRGEWGCATAVAVDGSNNVFVSGTSTNNAIGYDYTTIMYSSAGVPLWTNRYNGPANGDDYANAMAVDRSGNVFVTGESWNGTSYDFATIKYSFSPPPIPLSFQTLNHQLVLSWANAAFGLQSAPTLSDTFTNISGATSPYTNTISGDQQYFRLISN